MSSRRTRTLVLGLLVASAALAGGACSSENESLTVYSGRTADLVGPLFRRFEERTGIDVKVRYGDSAEMAGAVMEEGDNPRADVLIVQDAGNIGQIARAGRLATLDEAVLGRVPAEYRSHTGQWVGLSGRVRVVTYNTERLSEADLPSGIEGFTDPRWKGRLAWAPTNGSFQAFVTAFRVMRGEAATEAWLRGIEANEPRVYPNNVAIVEAVGRGEVDAGFVNHYYLYRLRAEGTAGRAANKYYGAGDPGGLVNVSAAGILKGSRHRADAERLVEFLLSDESQRYFADETYELPLVSGVRADPHLPEITTLARPGVDLARLDDAKGTVDLITRLGIL